MGGLRPLWLKPGGLLRFCGLAARNGAQPRRSSRNPGLRTVGEPCRHADRGASRRTSWVTTDPAPTLAKSPIVRSPRMVAPELKQNAAANPRGAAGIGFLSSDRDVLVDRHLIADRDGRAHDDACPMIQKHRRSNRCRRMDADLSCSEDALCSNSARSVRPPCQSRFETRQACQRDVTLEVSSGGSSRLDAGSCSTDALEIAARCIHQIGRSSKTPRWRCG